MMKNTMAKYQNFKHMVLIANNGKIGFFKKCGFFVSEGATAMEIRRNKQ